MSVERENVLEKKAFGTFYCLSCQKWNSLSSLAAEGDINDVLIKTLAEAHANTNIKLDVIIEMFRKPQVGLVEKFLLFRCCENSHLGNEKSF